MCLAGCGEDGASSKSRNGCRKIAEEFFKELDGSDPVIMMELKDGKENTLYMRSGDNMYVRDMVFGFEYYLFIEDGKKCVLSNSGNLAEDDFNYQLYMDTVGNIANQFILNNYDKDAFGEGAKVKYSARRTDEVGGNPEASSLFLTFDVTDGEEKTDIEVTAISESGKVKEIHYESASDAYTMNMDFIFSYDEFTIQVPEH